MIVKNAEQLRQPSEPVTLDEVADIIDKLEKELEASNKAGAPGLGLAAPQIGIHKRCAIVRVDNRNVNLVNPRIVEKLRPIEFDNEGCLSFPNMYVKTKRFDEIVVENDVEPKRFIATGLVAVVILHETDHLDGIVLPDLQVSQITPPTNIAKTKPNDQCPCGSGKKFKRCCQK